jgi:hypothetical protein
MEDSYSCELRDEVERPLCFGHFVPSPFCEGVRFPDRSKGLLRTYHKSHIFYTACERTASTAHSFPFIALLFPQYGESEDGQTVAT